ncbi:MAG TPA: hypothetical protein VFZ77_03665 [Acidimicrobiales bacterium]
MLVEPGRHLADEVLDVADPIEETDRARVVDLGVLVYEQVPEPDRADEAVRELLVDHAMGADEAHSIAVVLRGSPALGCAQVLRRVDDALDGRDEAVLQPGQALGIGLQRRPILAGSRLEVGELAGDPLEQPHQAPFIDHGRAPR